MPSKGKNSKMYLWIHLFCETRQWDWRSWGIPLKNSGRKIPCTGFTGRSRHSCRSTRIRKCSSSWIFLRVRNSIRNRICQEWLCWKNFHQTRTEQPWIKRADQVKCFKRSSQRKESHHDRWFHRTRNNKWPHCEDVTRCRSDRSSRKNQFPTIPVAMLLWNWYSRERTADRI